MYLLNKKIRIGIQDLLHLIKRGNNKKYEEIFLQEFNQLYQQLANNPSQTATTNREHSVFTRVLAPRAVQAVQARVGRRRRRVGGRRAARRRRRVAGR